MRINGNSSKIGYNPSEWHTGIAKDPDARLAKHKATNTKWMYDNACIDDAESHLTLSDFKEVEKNLKVLSAKNSHLEEKFNDLLVYLRTNSIEVSNSSS